MSQAAQAGATKEAFEKVREAVGGVSAEEMTSGKHGEVRVERKTWVSFALEDGEMGHLDWKPQSSTRVQLKVFLDPEVDANGAGLRERSRHHT